MCNLPLLTPPTSPALPSSECWASHATRPRAQSSSFHKFSGAPWDYHGSGLTRWRHSSLARVAAPPLQFLIPVRVGPVLKQKRKKRERDNEIEIKNDGLKINRWKIFAKSILFLSLASIDASRTWRSKKFCLRRMRRIGYSMGSNSTRDLGERANPPSKSCSINVPHNPQRLVSSWAHTILPRGREGLVPNLFKRRRRRLFPSVSLDLQ